jgi:hypothetical protein
MMLCQLLSSSESKSDCKRKVIELYLKDFNRLLAYLKNTFNFFVLRDTKLRIAK